jgi:hypothetical protein
MPPKTSAAARRPAAPRKKGEAIEIVVRRGSLRRFDALKTRTQELPVVVTWDRRTNDRRDDKTPAGAKRERRNTERRRTPPFTWELADFVVIERAKRRKSAPAAKATASARKRKKPSKKS